MPFIYILILSIFLSACSDNNNPKLFKDNIKEFNEFSRGISSEGGADKVIVFSDPLAEVSTCKKSSLVAKDIKLSQLAALLSSAYDADISYALNPDEAEKENSGNSVGTLEVNFKNVCLEEVIDTLTDVYNIGVAKVSSGYQIYQAESQTITYELNYHNFNRKGNSSISISSSNLSNESQGNQNYSKITSESEDKFWESVSSAIESILYRKNTNKIKSSKSKEQNNNNEFYVYKEAGLIIVTASPKQHKNIRNFLKKANINSVRQVMIEAKILEVKLKDEFNTGIQWDGLKNKLYQTSLASGGVVPGLRAAHGKVNLSTEEVKTSLVSGGRVAGGGGFNLIMQALSAQGKISVMSSPRVSALNNQRALIKSGEDKYFVTNVTSTDVNTGVSGSLSGIKSSYGMEPLFSGIALDTTPNIINNQEILLHIHPMISRVGTAEEVDVTSGHKASAPTVTIREVDTVVKAKSGDIIILGGMTHDYVSLSESQLPLKPPTGLRRLLDIFSAKKNFSSKTELIILMKPTIIENFSGIEGLGTYKSEIEE